MLVEFINQIKEFNPTEQQRQYIIIGLGGFLVFCGIILIYPFIPVVRYSLFPQSLTVEASDGKSVHIEDKNTILATEYTHTTFSLVIPEIGVDAPIGVSNNGWSDLNHGVWYYPESAKPNQNGLSVILGHRFAYSPPSQITLYLLDKLHTGSIIVVYWNNKRYNYLFNKSLIIPSNKELQYINEKSSQSEIALVTCTPLWSASQRLIIYATKIPN